MKRVFNSQRCTTCRDRPARRRGPVRLRRRCGDDGEPGPDAADAPVRRTSGPAPATADIQAFRINFWENVRGTQPLRQLPQRRRPDAEVRALRRRERRVPAGDRRRRIATTRRSRSSSRRSAAVTTAGCADAGACASIMTRWIQDWVGAAGTGGRAIELVEPPVEGSGLDAPLPAGPRPLRTSPTARRAASIRWSRRTARTATARRRRPSSRRSSPPPTSRSRTRPRSRRSTSTIRRTRAS